MAKKSEKGQKDPHQDLKDLPQDPQDLKDPVEKWVDPPEGEKVTPWDEDTEKHVVKLEMLKPTRSAPQIFPNRNRSIFCWMYNCRTPADWFIGRPDGPRNLLTPICNNCLKTIIQTMPSVVEEGIDKSKPLGYRCWDCDEVFTDYKLYYEHLQECPNPEEQKEA